MQVSTTELETAAEPLVRDLQATLGWDAARARSEVRYWLQITATNMGFTLAPSAVQSGAAEVVLDVVGETAERMQQWIHDDFFDTSWPCLGLSSG